LGGVFALLLGDLLPLARAQDAWRVHSPRTPDGVTLKVVEFLSAGGAASPAAVLIEPGSFDDLESWGPLIRLMQAQGFRVFGGHVRGVGRGAWASDPSGMHSLADHVNHDLPTHVRKVRELLPAGTPLFAIGHSMGALLLRASVQSSLPAGTFAGMAWIAPPAFGENGNPAWRVAARGLGPVLQLYAELLRRGALDQSWEEDVFALLGQLTGQERPPWIRVRPTPVRVLLEFIEAIRTGQFPEPRWMGLDGWSTPVWMMAAGRDVLIPPAEVKALAMRLGPWSRGLIFDPQATHEGLIHEPRLDLFEPILKDWRAELE
jgi:alpha-beta hydrolase superfamily lysophospholipase